MQLLAQGEDKVKFACARQYFVASLLSQKFLGSVVARFSSFPRTRESRFFFSVS